MNLARSTLLVILSLLAMLLVAPASAQYLYMDTNGDGVSNDADYLSPTGTTTLAIWVHTDQNKDGTSATCVQGNGELNMNAYFFVLRASGGTINWGTFQNRIAGFQLFTTSESTLNYFASPLAGGPPPSLSPGLYHLADLEVSVASGAPNIDFLPYSEFSPVSVGGLFGGGFGSECYGAEYTNELFYRLDFPDADGVRTLVEGSAFAKGSNELLNLNAPGWTHKTVNIEPVNGSFLATDVDLNSVTLSSQGTGSVSTISANPKIAIVGDRDNDRIPDIAVDFGRADLEKLFSLVSGSNNPVSATVRGNLLPGGKFAAQVSLRVSSGKSGLTAALRPNPLNPSGELRIQTTRRGFLRVSLFDVQGRLVRTLLNESDASVGVHRIAIDGRDDRGAALASGVYLYRAAGREGEAFGRFTLLK